MTQYRIQLGPPQDDLGNNRGPAVGQFALQRALKQNPPDWFRIGGDNIADDEIPWIWTYEASPLACHCHRQGRPFIIGPNMLFRDSRQPRSRTYERIILDSPHLKLMFTESQWYAKLIRENMGEKCKAEICVVPYPVSIPDGILADLPQIYDVLVYAKSGHSKELLEAVFGRFSQRFSQRRFVYGNYDRNDLIAAADSSKVCLYLSDDDRGPIAAAEILLTGCPIIGIERGCPWVREICGVGYDLQSFDIAEVIAIIEFALRHATLDLPRHRVRQRAAAFFSGERISKIIFAALDEVRQ